MTPSEEVARTTFVDRVRSHQGRSAQISTLHMTVSSGPAAAFAAWALHAGLDWTWEMPALTLVALLLAGALLAWSEDEGSIAPAHEAAP